MLKIEDLQVCYAGFGAQGISLEVKKGEIITLSGANGAGKTTTMNTIMGFGSGDEGEDFLDGAIITNMDTRHIVKNGLVLSRRAGRFSRILL
jgi:branched-chain amino acid transport system ATP-binding protein